ncbi:hypothetical protein ACJZ2D_016671 [Fusarium nematophilum]
MMTKLSILAFYLRFVITSGKLRGIIYATMVLTILYSIIASFVWVFACRPLEKSWDLTITDGSCIDSLKITVFSGVMNTVTDAVILFLPIAILQGLRLPRRQKVGVMMVMMTGGLWVSKLLYGGVMLTHGIPRVLGVSIVRLHATVDALSIQDLTWDTVPEGAWWTVEVHLALICASLASLKPFLRRFLPHVVGSSDEIYYNSTGGIPQTFHPASNPCPLAAWEGDEIPLKPSAETTSETGLKGPGDLVHSIAVAD